MLRKVPWMLSSLVFPLLAATALAAPPPGTPGRGGPGDAGPAPRPGRPGAVRPGVPEVRKEKAAFLGLVASPAGPTLREQLKLPKGVGMTVDFVEKDAPAAAAGLQPHDVITKLDDQWLVNFPQLAVLVRMHKAGETVKITYYPGGEAKTLDVKLAEKEVPVLDDADPWMMPRGRMPGLDMERLLPPNLGGPDGEGGPPRGLRPEGGWMRSQRMTVRPGPDGGSTRVFSDGQQTLTLTTDKDGHKKLVVTDKDAKEVFSGPVDTPEQRKALPEDIAGKLDRLDRVDRARGGRVGIIIGGQGGAGGGQGMSSAAAVLTRADEDGTITLSTDAAGDKKLVAKDKSGKVLFEGPVNTAEERKKVPENLLKKLEKLETAAPKIQLDAD